MEPFRKTRVFHAMRRIVLKFQKTIEKKKRFTMNLQYAIGIIQFFKTFWLVTLSNKNEPRIFPERLSCVQFTSWVQGGGGEREALRKKCPFPSYSGSYLPAFGLSTERYGVSLRIQSECGKIRTRITPNTDTFHAVRG